MTITEYAELAQRTASTKTREEKIGHGCLGLIGEAGEVIDIVKKQRYMNMPYETAQNKLIDEIGDCLWYWVELCTGLEFNIEHAYLLAQSMDTLCKNIIEPVSNIISTVCDGFIDDSSQKAKEYIDIEDMAEIFANIMYLLDFCHISLDNVKEHNIDKLKKRYPDGFSADRSNRRYE